MKRIIINGANGYVASNFILNLLNKGYKVHALVRANAKFTAEERMESILSYNTDGKYISNNNLEIHSYGLNEDNFGLSDDALNNIFSGNFDYYHFAASLKYDLKSKDEIFATNIGGVENSLKIYNRYSNLDSRFFFISTAYSCGKHPIPFEEKFYDNADISVFRNYYEQSKRFAENVIKNSIDKDGTKAHIIRLSQVVGNTETGVTKTDYGIFDFAKRMYSLSQRYPDKEVRMELDEASTQNLIPINTVVNYLMRTVEISDVPQIINIVAKESISNRFIIKSLMRLMPINIIPVNKLYKEDMNTLEKLIFVSMSFTGSYISTNLQFDTKQLDTLRPNNKLITKEDDIFKMLQYFINSLSEPRGTKSISKAC